jgi:hypothetical protein
MTATAHAWTDVYLTCFLVGLGLAALSFLLGAMQAHLQLHLPHGGHLHVPGHDRVNFGTAAGFLIWLGAGGYLLTRHATLPWWLTLLLAALLGFGGAAIIFAFAIKLLIRRERYLDRADYEMSGVIAVVTVSIRAGGTGEIVFSQAGSRRCAGARSADGFAIGKGTEVVVMHYERGIAYVRRWTDVAPALPQSRGGSDERSR